MKLPNGYGSVHKLSGKRRNPWRVRITVGYLYDEEKDRQVRQYKILGYYESKQKALQALAIYNENPYDLDADKLTFAECYKMWTDDYFKKITPSAIRTVEAAYRYCSSLYGMRMKDIRSYHLKACMEKGYVIATTGKDKGKKRFAAPNTQARMKSMFNLLFDYAVEHEAASANYARNFKLDKDIIKEKKEQKREILPFTNAELKTLWENYNFGVADMILIQVYSGWRPQELAKLQLKDIDLENNTMFGGMKTNAGKNRIVPIHPLIKDLIVRRYNEAKQLGSEFLFNDADSQTGMEMTYDKYRSRFIKVMKRLSLKHSPHECRHTFITIAKSNNMDEYVLKLIVGHEITDITEGVYTHRTIKQIKEEMNSKITKFITNEE